MVNSVVSSNPTKVTEKPRTEGWEKKHQKRGEIHNILKGENIMDKCYLTWQEGES